jgi:hypothetical protein
MNCSLNFMARKTNVSEHGTAARDKSAVNQRQRALLIAQLDAIKSRPQFKKIAPPRARLQITVDGWSQSQIVEPVKIRHAD